MTVTTETAYLTVPKEIRRRRPMHRTSPWVGVSAWIIGFLFIVPILWMLLTSLHSEHDAATPTPNLFAPLTFEHYMNVLGLTGGLSALAPLINSATAALVSTFLVLLFALPAAYATAIKPVKKTKDTMWFFLSTKFLPAVGGLLPIYLFAKTIGALDSIWFLSILYAVMNLPIAVWMLRSFLGEVPIEILEAAELDGANLTRTIWHVILPVAAPGIAATALICIIFSWNEFLLARTLTGVVAGTAPVFLSGFVTGQGLFMAQLSAACVVVCLPVVIAGFAAQDKLVAGLSMGAVK